MLGFACVAIGAPCRALFFELSSFPHWREVVEFAAIALRQTAMPGASFPLLTPGIALQLAARSRQLLRIILTRRTAQKSEIRKTYGAFRDAPALPKLYCPTPELAKRPAFNASISAP